MNISEEDYPSSSRSEEFSPNVNDEPYASSWPLKSLPEAISRFSPKWQPNLETPMKSLATFTPTEPIPSFSALQQPEPLQSQPPQHFGFAKDLLSSETDVWQEAKSERLPEPSRRIKRQAVPVDPGRHAMRKHQHLEPLLIVDDSDDDLEASEDEYEEPSVATKMADSAIETLREITRRIFVLQQAEVVDKKTIELLERCRRDTIRAMTSIQTTSKSFLMKLESQATDELENVMNIING